MQLHQRGVDLLINLHVALEHTDKLSEREVRELLAESAAVLADLLTRDVPREDKLNSPEFRGRPRVTFPAAVRTRRVTASRS
jgi:hypothetical protein